MRPTLALFHLARQPAVYPETAHKVQRSGPGSSAPSRRLQPATTANATAARGAQQAGSSGAVPGGGGHR